MTARRLLWLLLSLLVSTLAVLTRGFPSTGSDAGIYLSVAGRILAGDRLYRDVFDNKDPLFYFSQAFALRTMGWRGPFLLDFGWVFVGSIGALLLCWTVAKDVVAAAFGQVLYPFLITGIHYHAAYSETPALGLLPVAGYFAYSRRPRSAGVVAGVILLFKLVLLPMVIAIVVATLISQRHGGGDRRRQVVRFVGATAITALSVLVVLAQRGELGSYWATLLENRAYASRALAVNGWPAGIHGHLYVAALLVPTTARILIAAVLVVISTAALLSRDVRIRVLRSPLAILTVTSSVGTLSVLAAIALWDHHVQLLAFPLLCAAVLALNCVRAAAQGRRGPFNDVTITGLAVTVAIVLAFSLQLPRMANARVWTAQPLTQVSDALKAAASAKALSHPSFFHLGGNDDQGEAAFLGASYRLSCPRFHQYPFTPSSVLQETLGCMRDRNPELIAVTPKFRTLSTTSADSLFFDWNRFVIAGRAYLRSRCKLQVTNGQVRIYSCGRRR